MAGDAYGILRVLEHKLTFGPFNSGVKTAHKNVWYGAAPSVDNLKGKVAAVRSWVLDGSKCSTTYEYRYIYRACARITFATDRAK